jgi:alkylhydroperoxidase family enzyme
MSEADLAAIVGGPDDRHWDGFEAALLCATDQVLDRKPVDDRLWAMLAGQFTSQQLVDFMMTIAEFSLAAMMLTTFRIPLENRPNLPRLHDYLLRDGRRVAS